MASVWDRLPKRDDPYKEAFRGEWGWLGRMRFEWHRERMARRQEYAWNERLFWRRSQRPEGVRHLIAGFLVIEGLVALAVGLVLMLIYWPPVQNGAMADPISFVGLGITGASIAYMVFVGLGVKLYSLLHPLPGPEQAQAEEPEDEPDPHKTRGDGSDRKPSTGWGDSDN